MAAIKKGSSPTADVDVNYVIIRKNRPFVRHSSPIRFSEYKMKDGRVRQIKFDKEQLEYKTYGEYVWTVEVTNEPVYLNLKDPIDNLKYRFAKELKDNNLHPFSHANPLLIIEEPERDDHDKVSDFKRQFEALSLLNGIEDPDDRREFAYYWGVHTGTDTRVFLSLKEIAQDRPEEFIEAYNDEYKHVVILVRKAIDLGLVSKRGDTHMYYFNDHQLGLRYDDIVAELVKNADLLALLNREVQSRK